MTGIILKSPPTIIHRQVHALHGLDNRFKNGQRQIAHTFSQWSRGENGHSQNSSSGNGPHGDGNQSKGQPRKVVIAVATAAALAAAVIPGLTPMGHWSEEPHVVPILAHTKMIENPYAHSHRGIKQMNFVDFRNLANIFASVEKYPVAVISIQGPRRGGKSFVLSYLARYLRIKGAELPDYEDETMAPSIYANDISNREVPKYFTSNWGDQGKTLEIQMLQPILIPAGPKPGDKVAVILMECQNIFDDDYTTAEVSMDIYLLCSLLSSIMILNVHKGVDQRVFENLHYYSRTFQTILDRLSENDTKIGPLYTSQWLIILIRDFQWYPQYEYGLHDNRGAPRRTQDDARNPPQRSRGMSTISKNYFNTKFCNAEIPQQYHAGRQEILKIFEPISFFLLPSPGDKFLNQSQFSSSDDLDESFKRQLESFFDTIVKDPTSIVKKVNGLPLTGRDFWEYIDHIMLVWEDLQTRAKVVPPPLQDLTSMAAHFINKEVEEEVLNLIHTRCTEFLNESKNGVNEQEMQNFVLKWQREALDQFQKRSTLNNDRDDHIVWVKLSNKIIETCQPYMRQNRSNLEIFKLKQMTFTETTVQVWQYWDHFAPVLKWLATPITTVYRYFNPGPV